MPGKQLHEKFRDGEPELMIYMKDGTF